MSGYHRCLWCGDGFTVPIDGGWRCPCGIASMRMADSSPVDYAPEWRRRAFKIWFAGIP